MTPEDGAFLAELCATRAGLRVDPEKVYLIESRLGAVARREKFSSVDELLEALRRRPQEPLTQACVEAMAASETSFFRDRAVFDHLWRVVVPDLARSRPDGVVRIWSAGCASGQEIYSLAMLQEEAPAPTGKVELFASDLSERLLDRARLGSYSTFEVQRGLAARQLVRHFENRDDLFQVAKPLRQAVRWRQVNLMDDLAPLGVFDIVLCRYVLNGLTPGAQSRVLDNLAVVTAPGGLLVLGESEAPAVSRAFVADANLSGVYRRAGQVSAAA